MNALTEGLAVVFQWQNILLIVVGFLIGHLFGLLPGLSSLVAIAILIPWTYSMSLDAAMVFLMAIQGGGIFAGSITSILIGIPGQAVNAMTLNDGYPLGRQGRGAYAIAAAGTASALGSTFSVLLLALMIPFMIRILKLFSPPEVFVFVVFGLFCLAMASRGAYLKDLISGALGLLVSMIGFNNVVGGTRYAFGMDYLWNGLPMIGMFIGMFAVSEFISIAIQRSGGIKAEIASRGFGAVEGIKSVFKHWFLWLRCSIFGFIIGVIPGLGGVAASLVSYSHALQTEKNTQNFGKGDIRGVIAPESSNNAVDGGALIPTLGLGIPGSPVMAILLGAFILHGIRPGTNMFQDNLTTVWALLFAYIIANYLTSAFGIGIAEQLAKLLRLPPLTYMPVIVVVGLVGSYVANYDPIDLVTTVGFGILGYVLMVSGFSRLSFVIGFILGPLTEQYYFQSLQMWYGDYKVFLFHSPLAIVLWVILIVTQGLYWWSVRKRYRVIQQMKE